MEVDLPHQPLQSRLASTCHRAAHTCTIFWSICSSNIHLQLSGQPLGYILDQSISHSWTCGVLLVAVLWISIHVLAMFYHTSTNLVSPLCQPVMPNNCIVYVHVLSQLRASLKTMQAFIFEQDALATPNLLSNFHLQQECIIQPKVVWQLLVSLVTKSFDGRVKYLSRYINTNTNRKPFLT